MERAVVIGASAGGVETIRALMGHLPSGLPATFFIVQHRGPESTDVLASVLQGRGRMPVENAQHELKPAPGKAYVAPAGVHLVLHKDMMLLTQGPRENRSRPSIDVLFRSAAVAYGPRAIAVLLSGLLDDGVAGLGAIKRCGGTTIVQDPDTAPFPQLPENALHYAPVDEVAPVERIAEVLTELIKAPLPEGEFTPPPDLVREVELSQDTMGAELQGPGTPSFFVCPDCGGSMKEVIAHDHRHYRCHTGHAYGQETLLHGISQAAEDALWNALRVLEERQKLLTRLVEMERTAGRNVASTSYCQRLDETARHIAALREQLGIFRTNT